MKKAMLMGIAMVVILISGCGPGGQVKIGEADNGGQVALGVGQTLVLTLKSNPTTGYGWQIAEMDEAVLKATSQEYKADQPVLLGSGGNEVWQFQAQSSGSTTLRLEYRRPWEEDVEPIQTFSVQVVVR